MRSKLALALLLVSLPAYGAREFGSGEQDYIRAASAVTTGYTVTICAWATVDDLTAVHTLLNIGLENNSSDFRHVLQFRGDDYLSATDRVRLFTGSDIRTAATTSSYSTGTWHHTTGVSNGDSDRSAYIDGGSEGNDTVTSSAGSTPTHTWIGATAITSQHHDGLVGPVAIWISALTDAEVASLGAGRDPRTLATVPDHFLTMVGGVQDTTGGLTWTDNGTANAGQIPLGW